MFSVPFLFHEYSNIFHDLMIASLLLLQYLILLSGKNFVKISKILKNQENREIIIRFLMIGVKRIENHKSPSFSIIYSKIIRNYTTIES